MADIASTSYTDSKVIDLGTTIFVTNPTCVAELGNV